MIQDIMPGTEELFEKEQVSGYIGFDPTSDSLHIGSLVPILLLVHLQRAGHKPVALVGGATGMVGDPSGRSEERNLLDADTLAANVSNIKTQLERLLDFGAGPNQALLVDNADWTGQMGVLDFLRDVGKHVTVNQMLARESIKLRVNSDAAADVYHQLDLKLQYAQEDSGQTDVGLTDRDFKRDSERRYGLSKLDNMRNNFKGTTLGYLVDMGDLRINTQVGYSVCGGAFTLKASVPFKELMEYAQFMDKRAQKAEEKKGEDKKPEEPKPAAAPAVAKGTLSKPAAGAAKPGQAPAAAPAADAAAAPAAAPAAPAAAEEPKKP